MTVELTASEKDRNEYIGGSDVAKIMSGDWYNLWLEKTGQVKHTDLSDVFQVQLGTVTETFNIEWFYKNYTDCAKQNIIQSRHSPSAPINPRQLFGINTGTTYECFMRGNLDDVCMDGSGSICAIEAKHTSALGMRFKNIDEAIETYMPQMQFYLYLLHQNFPNQRIGGCYFPIIFGNVWHCVKVSSYAGYQIDMVDAIHRFKKHVDAYDPSNPKASEPIGYKPKQTKITTEQIPVNGMIRKDLSSSNSFVHACGEYMENKKKADISKKDLDESRDKVLSHVPDNAREVYSSTASVKRTKNNTLRITIKEE